MESQQSMNGSDQMKLILGAVHFVCRSLAASVEVFLHKSRTFGERYLGLQAAAAVLVIFFSTAFWRGENVAPVFLFLLAYLIACGIARFAVWRRLKSGGEQIHTQYTGMPRIMRWTGSMSEETVKRLVEPMLVFLLGALPLQGNLPLGTYLMLAAGGLFASVNLAAGFDRTRALDMHDAYLDQCNTAERFRQTHGQ